VALVGISTIVAIKVIQPSLVFKDTTPTGGDMGAHVWGPAYLRDHLLPWKLNGWSMDWYSGLPVYRCYMVVPALFVVILNFVFPYGVALKIVAVAGIVLGWIAYARRAEPPREPAILAAGWRYDAGVSAFVAGPGRRMFDLVATTDAVVVDGAVDGAGRTARGLGRLLGRVQSGFVRSYALITAVGAVAVLAWFLLRGILS
jgi:NADH:ubiquinone oxidoreductase subunit 5 (subunit L)/multisubunit Na+/H+ antiporter MnhA subunit